jgi:hypothetical protein
VIIMKKIAFLLYLFILSYFVFNETSCNSVEFLDMNCKWVLIFGKGVLIGVIFIFIDRKFLFFNSSKE